MSLSESMHFYVTGIKPEGDSRSLFLVHLEVNPQNRQGRTLGALCYQFQSIRIADENRGNLCKMAMTIIFHDNAWSATRNIVIYDN
jgi:hypothetical protein